MFFLLTENANKPNLCKAFFSNLGDIYTASCIQIDTCYFVITYPEFQMCHCLSIDSVLCVSTAS